MTTTQEGMAGAHPAEADGEPIAAAAEAWLECHVAGYCGPGTLRKFSFGQSNPTFRLTAESGDYVLRRKPLGTAGWHIARGAKI